MDVEVFKKLPVMGILRGVREDAIEPLIEAIVASGLKTIEITMNTSEAEKLIRKTVKVANGRLMVGAGTVLTMNKLHQALDSGATFIVLPCLGARVVKHCAQNKIPVFPGAFSPQEIYNAWRAGATMVKVFPAKFFGPSYLKEIKGPFNDIQLLACGGIRADTIGRFFSSGASAVAFGGSIFKKEWLERGDFWRIGEHIELLLKAYESQKSQDSNP